MKTTLGGYVRGTTYFLIFLSCFVCGLPYLAAQATTSWMQDPSLTPGQRQSLERLGPDVEIKLDSSGVPRLLKGNLGARASDDSIAAAKMALDTVAPTFRRRSEDSFAFSGKTQKDKFGQTHVRMTQTYWGVPVVGGELIVHMTDDDIVGVSGRFIADIASPVQPSLSADQAAQAALAYQTQVGITDNTLLETRSLVIWVGESDGGSLAYPVRVRYSGTSGLAIDDFFISAADGRLLGTHPRLWTGKARSTYSAGPECPTQGVPGTLLFQEGGSSSDADAQSAYDYAGISYDYYSAIHGRDSWNGAGASIISSVHFHFTSSCNGNNAAWLGAPYSQMVFGDGDGVRFNSFARSLDVVAHELTHAVTDSGPDLVYQSESGALNEASSDILGVSTKFWYCNAHSTVCTPHWVQGEGLPADGSSGLRYMYDPVLDGVSYDYYPTMRTSCGNTCEVHYASGIANLAYYLLVNGGQHPRNRTTVSVTGIGLSKAEAIWYRALTVYMTANESFQNARDDSAAAAQDLYGWCSPEWTNVQKAWDAVGVPGTWSCAQTQLTLTVSKTGTAGSSVVSTPAGIDCGSTCSASFSGGTRVELNWTAPPNVRLSSWGGACTGNGKCVVKMNGDTTVTANFAPGYTLTVSKNGGGAGSVTSSGSGIDCGTTCSATYDSGAYVYLNATAPAGSVFAGWSGACTGTYNSCSVTMDSAKKVSATFYAVPAYTLTVTREGTGSGSVSSSTIGINCGNSCSAPVNRGTVVYLYAYANSGSTFAGWSGACSGTGSCSVTMDAAKTVTAKFIITPTYSVTIAKSGNGSGSGTIVSSPAGINCGSACSAGFAAGTYLSLTATAPLGTILNGWGGACQGTSSTCSFTVNGPKTVTATFTQAPTYTLSVGVTGSGSVSSSPSGISCGNTCSAVFNGGTTVTLSASPSSGAVFAGWGGACTGTGSCQVAMNAASSVTASFTPVPTYTLSVGKLGAGSGTVTSSSGINCGSTCSAAVQAGNYVYLDATPAAGSVFLGWSGACNGTYNSCGFSMNDSTLVNAVFGAPPNYTLTASVTGPGSVSMPNLGTSCTGVCSKDYAAGSFVWLSTYSNTGATFAGWTGACTGRGSCTVYMGSAAMVGASFTAMPSKVVTVARNGSGTGTVTSSPAGIDCGSACSATFPADTYVNLTATADTNSVFTGWSGACSSTNRYCYLSSSSSQNVTATFAARPGSCDAVPILPGQTLTGEVSSSCPSLNSAGNYSSLFSTYASAGQVISFGASSTAFSPSGYIIGPNGAVLDSYSPYRYTVTTAGTYTFEVVGSSKGTGAFTIFMGPRRGMDFDGNGSSDLLLHNRETGAGELWTTTGVPISISKGVLSSPGPEWEIAGIADFDGDGYDDVVWRKPATNEVTISFMNGSSVISSATVDNNSMTDRNWSIVAVGDFSGDGKADLLWRNQVTGENRIWRMDGAVVSYTSTLPTLDANWKVAGVGDFDGNGTADVLWRNPFTGENAIYLSSSYGSSSTSPVRTMQGQKWQVAAIADFDGNGTADILWYNVANGEMRLWSMNGFAMLDDQPITPAVPDLNWEIVRAGDYNGDGKAEILWRNKSTGAISVWSMNGATRQNVQVLDTITDPNWEVYPDISPAKLPCSGKRCIAGR